MHGHTLARMKRCIPFALALMAIIAACDANNATGPQTGTLKGSIKDTAGDPLVGVRVVVFPYQGDSIILHSGSDGSWQIKGISIGPGNVGIDSLPPDCDTIPPLQFFLASPGTTASLTLTVFCSQRHQVVAGRSDFDGGAIDRVRRGRLAARRVGVT